MKSGISYVHRYEWSTFSSGFRLEAGGCGWYTVSRNNQTLNFLPGCCLVASSCLTLCDTMGCSSPGKSVHGESAGENTGVGCHAHLQGIFLTQRSNLPLCASPAFQVDSLPTEPHGKLQLLACSSVILLFGCLH